MVNMSETFVAMISLNGGNYYDRELIILFENLDVIIVYQAILF